MNLELMMVMMMTMIVAMVTVMIAVITSYLSSPDVRQVQEEAELDQEAVDPEVPEDPFHQYPLLSGRMYSR